MSNAYLDVRIAFAIAKIASIVDPNDDSFAVPMADAEALGQRDAATASDGSLPVPIYFADEPNLAESWKRGIAIQEAEEETSGMCSFCFKGHEFWQCPHLEH
ncbi:hypothetical protein [Paraburkholderia sp. XV]|uniref:hypothetical protein n=1 Tax=Paraburkholderia sp. XV TaxID=2831520 RepID=UPI001CD59988|nr:hypothetical protein [Paraburkholderia sp. XV]